MARLLVAGVLVLLGLVLISAGFQEYVDGSCAAGNCVFNHRLDDPIFVIAGGLAIVAGVLLFLNKFPLWRKQIVEPIPPTTEQQRREKQYPPRNDGASFALFALQAVGDTSYAAERSGDVFGVTLFTFLTGAAIAALLVWLAVRAYRKAQRNRNESTPDA